MRMVASTGTPLLLESLTFWGSVGGGVLAGFLPPLLWADAEKVKKMADKAATMCNARGFTAI